MNTKIELDYYLSVVDKRKEQANILYDILIEHFKFEKFECIETGASQNLGDGCFGLYLSKIAENTNGKYISVDISSEIIDKSRSFFKKHIPNFETQHIVSDSVSFLKSYDGSPNFVHLDSWDLDLKNPIPSMLHGWLEFDAIKNKMPSGSIIIVDDNYLRGTWVNWIQMLNGRATDCFERIDINYDIVGKGSLIYHWCLDVSTDWDLIGNHYLPGDNIKVIIKKR